MLDIDRNLAESEVAIPWRPIHALLEISRRLQVTITSNPGSQANSGTATSEESWDDEVHRWYERRYGDRIKTNLSPGRIAILIEEDVWAIRIGRVLGSVTLKVSRNTESRRKGTRETPAVYNVLDAVEKLPQSRRHELPDAELAHIFEKFMLGTEAFSYLEGSAATHELIHIAIGDISAAVEHLVKERAEYGLSKWASSQAAEKVLKAVIALNEQEFPTNRDGHNLIGLAKQLLDTGAISDDLSMLVRLIQTPAGIRYGSIDCSRYEAILAHNASLGLIVALGRGSSVLQANLALQQTG